MGPPTWILWRFQQKTHTVGRSSFNDIFQPCWQVNNACYILLHQHLGLAKTPNIYLISSIPFAIFRTHPIFPSLDVLFHPPVPHLWLLLLKKRYDNERSSVNHRSWTWIWTVSRHQLHFGQVIDTPTSRMSIRPLIIGCKLWRLHVVKGAPSWNDLLCCIEWNESHKQQKVDLGNPDLGQMRGFSYSWCCFWGDCQHLTRRYERILLQNKGSPLCDEKTLLLSWWKNNNEPGTSWNPKKTSIFGGSTPPKTRRPFTVKTRVIWRVPGI